MTTTSSSSLVVTPELAARIAAVEQVMLRDFGPHHVPDALDRLRYFAGEANARVERHREAERRVRAHDARVEQLRQRVAALTAAREQFRVPTPGEMSQAQRREFAETGRVTLTGYEPLDDVLGR